MPEAQWRSFLQETIKDYSSGYCAGIPRGGHLLPSSSSMRKALLETGLFFKNRDYKLIIKLYFRFAFQCRIPEILNFTAKNAENAQRTAKGLYNYRFCGPLRILSFLCV